MPAEIRHRGHSGRANDALVLADDLRFTPLAALRVDWQKDPVAEPACVWDVYKLQLADYITRALDPAAAPG